MKFNKIIFIILMFNLILACNKKSNTGEYRKIVEAEKILITYLECIKIQNFDKAYSLTSSAFQKSADVRKFYNFLKNRYINFKAVNSRKRLAYRYIERNELFKIGKTPAYSDTYEVVFLLTYPDKYLLEKIIIIKKNGYKINDIYIRKISKENEYKNMEVKNPEFTDKELRYIKEYVSKYINDV